MNDVYPPKLRILHTSDWHLGQIFYNQKRDLEHKLFLDWLINIILQYQVDILLICGDVFDVAFPPNYALEIFYNFLAKCCQTNCHHVVVLAGNHDSPTTLNAPKEILKHINVSIYANIDPQNISNNLLIVKNKYTKLPLAVIVCIPFIREKEIYSPKPEETLQERENAIISSLYKLYTNATNEAIKVQSKINIAIPVIATGHLFVEFSKNINILSERLLYGCYNASVPTDLFPSQINYVALGHLHSHAKITKENNQIICYSGSPIPLSFEEAHKPKYVILIEFELINNSYILYQSENIIIPQFQQFYTITGNCTNIINQIRKIAENSRLNNNEINPWLKIIITEEENIDSAFDQIQNIASINNMKILQVAYQNSNSFQENRINNTFLGTISDINMLSPFDVFKIRLEQEDGLSVETKNKLITTFSEVLQEIYQRQSSHENIKT